jgi:hypothetical protein
MPVETDTKPTDGYECKEEYRSESKQCNGTTTCLFFDYDDTLLASSYLFNLGMRLDTDFDDTHNEIRKQLQDLEQAVEKVLLRAANFGRVCIVTNAEAGWVERSAEKFMPSVYPLLAKTEILSARTLYELKHPDKPVEWKACAFQDALKTFLSNGQSKSHIISFGDSNVEREAIRIATGPLMNNRTKSVKFAEHPTIEQLKRQLELIHNCFHYLTGHDGDLDLQLTVTRLPPTSPTTVNPPSPTTPTTPAAAVPQINKTPASCGTEYSKSLQSTPYMPSTTAQGS